MEANSRIWNRLTTSSPRAPRASRSGRRSGATCSARYHVSAPGTDFTQLLKGLPNDLCGVEHWAYVLKGTLKVIYLDGTTDICTAGDVCFWPAPHNFISDEGAEIIQFSTAGGLAAQGAIVAEIVAKRAQA